MSISKGLRNKLGDLHQPKSDIEAIDCLTSTHGLAREQHDDDNMFKVKTSILHVARNGKPDRFSSVLSAIRVRLGLQQVIYAIDYNGPREEIFIHNHVVCVLTFI